MKGNLNMRGQGIILCIKILNILMQSSTITKSHQILDAYVHHLGVLLVYLCLLLLYMQMILCFKVVKEKIQHIRQSTEVQLANIVLSFPL